MNRIAIFAAAALGVMASAIAAEAPASTTPPRVVVAPMHSAGSLIRYPRIKGLANAAVQAKVNAIFAAREKAAHEDRDGCFDLIRDAGRRPNDANFTVKIDVRYVSPRYVSLEIYRSYDCAGPYPTDNMPEPLTVDLTTGAEVDWPKIFKTNPAPDESGLELPSALYRLYKQRYAKEGAPGVPECQGVVQEALGSLFLRLDARRGLIVQPDFPHVSAACATEIAFAVDDIAPLIRDAAFLADLRATVGK